MLPLLKHWQYLVRRCWQTAILFLVIDTPLFVFPAFSAPAWKTSFRSRGIVYKPLPSDVDPSNSTILNDSDLYNSDFPALWGQDSTKGVRSRDDLKILVSQGFNRLHIYDWNPTGRNHIPFLDRCADFGVGVYVPISNFAVDDTTMEVDEDFVTSVVDTTRVNGQIHKAVFGWMILNEYDLVPKLSIDSVVSIINIVNEIDPDVNRPFCVPVSTQSNYLGVSEPGLGGLVELHENLPKDIFQNRFMHGTNPFMPFANIETDIFEPYLKQFKTWGEEPAPLLLTEIGRSSGDIGAKNQNIEVEGLAEGFMDYMTGKKKNVYNFAGFFLFEYTQEIWKGGAETLYGLNELGKEVGGTPATTNVVAPGTPYKVEELKPVKALTSFVDTVCTRIKDLPANPTDNLQFACSPAKDINPSNSSGSIPFVVIIVIISVGLVTLVAVTVCYILKRKRVEATAENDEPLLTPKVELRKSTGDGMQMNGSNRSTTNWV